MNLNVLALPGTAVFMAAFIASLFLGLSLRKAWAILYRSVVQLAPSLLAINAHAGHGVYDALCGNGHHHRAKSYAHGLDLSVVRDAAGLDRSRIDRD